jgi:hypothetical protein
VPHLIVDGADPDAWAAARLTGISASSIPRAMTKAGRAAFLDDYFNPPDMARMQKYLDHGHRREQEFLGRWAYENYGLKPNKALWAHYDFPRHLATPDAIGDDPDDLGEFKTSTKPLPATTPRDYRDQMQWQMWVMQRERVLLVWEQHQNFVATGLPEVRWVHRDEDRIRELVTVANALLFEIDMRRDDEEN